MSDDIDDLKKKILSLESELVSRQQDIALYQKELMAMSKELKFVREQIENNISSIETMYNLFVPTKISKIPGFEFSSKFCSNQESGGDYFDIFSHIDKSRFGITMSASSSYMMSGLILSSLITLNKDILQGVLPLKIMNQLVTECSSKMRSSDSISVFYSFLDRRNYQLNYCLLGDICALLYSNASGRLTLLKPLSQKFQSFLDDNCNTEQTVSLESKDRLILCSPGVFSVKNKNNEAFGKERLFQVVVNCIDQNVHQLKNNILYAVDQFMLKAQQDRTIIVVGVSDKVIKIA